LAPCSASRTHGESLLEILESLLPQLGGVKPVTAAIGITAMLFLLWGEARAETADGALRPRRPPGGQSSRRPPRRWRSWVCTAAVGMMGLDARGVGILGAVPAGLPKLALPSFDARAVDQDPGARRC
jgi:SulP family sulfate permease